MLHDKIFRINNIELFVKCGGRKNGNIIIFLHGFPEFWYGWKNQIAFFLKKEYYVVVPDLRGYNLSSKPKGVKEYLIEKTTSDIVLLIQKLGKNKVTVVGHDWGGVIAWTLAMEHPELLNSVVLLNIPHPKVVLNYIIKHPIQILRSSYIGFFQIPIVPELLLRFFNFKLMEQMLISSSKRGTFSQEDINMYKKSWNQQGALRAMLHWYRALKYSKRKKDIDVSAATLLIWGKKDKFLSHGMAPLSISKCKNGTLIILDKASHWLHHEYPEEVNKLIYEFVINSKN